MADRSSEGFPVAAGHVEPVPRRIRAVLAGETVLDTTRALYVWERPAYPQYYIPLADIRAGVLTDDGRTLAVGDVRRANAAKVISDPADERLRDTVRFDWQALDAWYEEDEQVFVHPRSPYTRVDALRSSRAVRVELAGVVLAHSSATVMVFETGLPTRYYFERTAVDFHHLTPTDTVTACPYKGVTSGYWTAHAGGTEHADIAWAYDFPTRELLPIAGLIAFYNERVDLFVAGCG